jgi:hypothetical protein
VGTVRCVVLIYYHYRFRQNRGRAHCEITTYVKTTAETCQTWARSGDRGYRGGDCGISVPRVACPARRLGRRPREVLTSSSHNCPGWYWQHLTRCSNKVDGKKPYGPSALPGFRGVVMPLASTIVSTSGNRNTERYTNCIRTDGGKWMRLALRGEMPGKTGQTPAKTEVGQDGRVMRVCRKVSRRLPVL